MFKFNSKLPSAVIAIALTIAMLFSVAMPTFAYTASVGSVAEDVNGEVIVGQDVDQGKQTEYSDDITVEDIEISEDCDVYATLPDSGIVVTVPKVQILDGKSAAANVGVYTVAVRGDISAKTVINVVPVDEMPDRDGVNFEMSSAGKTNIPTDVDQPKTTFTYADGVRPDTPATTTGTITAHGMTAGQWNGDFEFNIWSDIIDKPLTTDEIIEKYDLMYYSALNLAVTDVNNDAIGENADVEDLDQAVAAIYTDEDGNINVVLLKDSVENVRTSPSVDMTINLGGNTLSVNNAIAIDVISGNVTIDGRLDGSAIVMDYDTTTGRCIQTRLADSLTVLGGTYEINSSCTNNSAPIFTACDTTIKDATIKGCNDAGTIRGIFAPNNKTINVSNCTIEVDGTTNSYGISSTGITEVSDSTVIAISPYTATEDGTDYAASSVGIISVGTLTLNNCYVKGTHSGVNSDGNLYVDGGKYEGYAHGGFYVVGDETNEFYIENAEIRECAWYGSHEATLVSNHAGIYVAGGRPDSTVSTNLKVYMNNCDIYGSNYSIAIRKASGEKTNSLYISNSTINSDAPIRIDDETHKLYIGQGCNFTADNTTKPSCVVNTDEVYSRPE